MNIKTFLQRYFTKKDQHQITIDELTAHVDETHKDLYQTVLKNQLNYIDRLPSTDCPHCGKSISADTEAINRLLPKIAVKVLDELLIVRNFVGFQPIQGPVGLIYKLRTKSRDENEDGTKRLTLEIISHAVEAASRKLHARWTIESSQDMKIQHGLNMEDEIIHAVATETASEFIDEILSILQTTKKEIPYADGFDLSLQISKAANDIARKTRRGAGNFVIVSPTNLVLLQTTGNSFVSATEEEKTKDRSRLRFAGTLNETIRVYCDFFVDPDTVIVGYKGSTDTDCGLVFSPYTMLVSTGIVMDPLSFQPCASFMTRYSNSFDEDAVDYYVSLKQAA